MTDCSLSVHWPGAGLGLSSALQCTGDSVYVYRWPDPPHHAGSPLSERGALFIKSPLRLKLNKHKCLLLNFKDKTKYRGLFSSNNVFVFFCPNFVCYTRTGTGGSHRTAGERKWWSKLSYYTQGWSVPHSPAEVVWFCHPPPDICGWLHDCINGQTVITDYNTVNRSVNGLGSN